MKKNNGFIIFLISILSILFIVVLFVMVYLLNNDYSFTSSNHQKLYEKAYSLSLFDDVHLSVTDSDVFIKKSDTNQVRVEIYGEENKSSSVIRDRILEIKKSSSNRMCFFFCFSERDAVYLYLPKESSGMLSIQSRSGDIVVEDFPNLELDITTNSGDTSIDTVSNLKVKTSSGDLDIHSILGGINITSYSGDVMIDSLSILKNSSISTSSGDVSISSASDCYIDAQTKSGDISIKNNDRFANTSLEIKTRSGDIEVY